MIETIYIFSVWGPIKMDTDSSIQIVFFIVHCKKHFIHIHTATQCNPPMGNAPILPNKNHFNESDALIHCILYNEIVDAQLITIIK